MECLYEAPPWLCVVNLTKSSLSILAAAATKAPTETVDVSVKITPKGFNKITVPPSLPVRVPAIVLIVLLLPETWFNATSPELCSK